MVEADTGGREQGEVPVRITLDLRPKDKEEPAPSTSGSDHFMLGYYFVPGWKKDHLIFLEAEVHFAAAENLRGVGIPRTAFCPLTGAAGGY